MGKLIIWSENRNKNYKRIYFQFSQIMSQQSPAKQQQIDALMKQKVVDLDSIVQNRGFLYNFTVIAQQSFSKLTKNVLGDYSYTQVNRYNVDNKLKILEYLKQKYLMIAANLDEQNRKNFYRYDPEFFHRKPKDLAMMKEMVLQGKSQVQAAQGSLQRLKASRDYIRAQFINQAAYQFDRQRYCSIYWGFLTGCLINSTIYKKGRTIRKAALAVTVAHLFGQISYYMNLDKYFDSVYAIFEEEAEAFMRDEKKRAAEADRKVFIKNKIED